MFSIGNINPLKRMVGNSMPINEISIATCWEFVLTEMKMPRVRHVMMNSVLSAKSKTTLPLTGKSRTKTLSKMMDPTFIKERRR